MANGKFLSTMLSGGLSANLKLKLSLAYIVRPR